MNKKSLKTLCSLFSLGILFSPICKSINNKGSRDNPIVISNSKPANISNLKRKNIDSEFCEIVKIRKTQPKIINSGIYNVGNNCYINALLQQLYDIKDFRNWILNYNTGNDKTSEKIKSIKYIFNCMSGNEIYNLNNLKNCMQMLGHKGRQEDLQECIQSKWFDVLDLFISQKFKNIKSTENYIFTNPLYIAELNNSAKLPNVHTANNKLILFLNRTLFDKGIYKKDTTMLERPLSFFGNNHYYKLTGSIIHSGKNITHGHYYSYKYNEPTKKWYLYDDSIVREVSENEVFEDTRNNGICLVFKIANVFTL